MYVSCKLDYLELYETCAKKNKEFYCSFDWHFYIYRFFVFNHQVSEISNAYLYDQLSFDLFRWKGNILFSNSDHSLESLIEENV